MGRCYSSTRNCDGEKFFTLYGHPPRLDQQPECRQHVARGQQLRASLLDETVLGAHAHFQIILDLLELGATFLGRARFAARVWTSLSPDANLLLENSTDRFPAEEPRFVETLAARQACLAKLSISYGIHSKCARLDAASL